MTITREVCTTLGFFYTASSQNSEDKVKTEEEKNGGKKFARHLPNVKEK